MLCVGSQSVRVEWGGGGLTWDGEELSMIYEHSICKLMRSAEAMHVLAAWGQTQSTCCFLST